MVFSCWGRDNLKFPSGSVDVPSLVPFYQDCHSRKRSVALVGYLTGQGNAILRFGE